MHMKRISLWILLAFSILSGAVSCHGSLDIVQDNRLTASNMWKTSTQVKSSANTIYDLIRTNFSQDYISMLHWGELRVGSYMWGYSHVNKVYTSKEVLDNNMTSSSSSCKWSALYTAIDQANAVIKYAASDKISMTDADRSWALGQAYFARAYCYFWAARIWGGVPLNLNPIEAADQPELYPVRAKAEQVYEQIGKDIEAAVSYSEFLGNNKYLATKDAVNMLKAEYSLWMYTNQKGGAAYLEKAEEALDAVGINEGDPRLLADYSKIFDGRGTNNKNSAEVVFAYQNDQNYTLTGGFAKYFTYAPPAVKKDFQNNPVPVATTQWLDYGDDYLKLMRDSRDKKGDTRIAANLGDGLYGQNASINDGVLTWPNKYIGDLSTGVMINDSDYVYYRYGLAVMMHAELKYYQEDYNAALKSLNMIAKRAYKKDNYYTAVTKGAVLDALTHEYFLEFPCEGVIWWALIRLDKIWDYNEQLKSRKDATNILLWPIHKDARNKNSKLTQTPGWY